MTQSTDRQPSWHRVVLVMRMLPFVDGIVLDAAA
jgi:hypothetical protein